MFYLAAIAVLMATITACTAEKTILPMKVSLNYSNVTITPGETLTLLPDITPNEAAIKTVTWSSNNTAVATVTDGEVTASEGVATIPVTTNKRNNTKREL